MVLHPNNQLMTPRFSPRSENAPRWNVLSVLGATGIEMLFKHVGLKNVEPAAASVTATQRSRRRLRSTCHPAWVIVHCRACTDAFCDRPTAPRGHQVRFHTVRACPPMVGYGGLPRPPPRRSSPPRRRVLSR